MRSMSKAIRGIREALVLDRIPMGLNWTPVIVTRGHELKVVVPQDGLDPLDFAGLDFHRDIVECGEIAEPFGHGDHLDADGLGRAGGLGVGGHAIASMKALDPATAPNTPPCILIILMAWS